MDCNIYGVRGGGSAMMRAKLVSPDMFGVMRAAGTLVGGVYSSVVAHQTGALSHAVRVQLGIGGLRNDRAVCDVVVGEGLPRGGYGASHEFGIGIHPQSHTPMTSWMPQAAADDLVKVLAIVNSM